MSLSYRSGEEGRPIARVNVEGEKSKIVYLNSEVDASQTESEEDLDDELYELLSELDIDIDPEKYVRLSEDRKRKLIVTLRIQSPKPQVVNMDSDRDIRVPMGTVNIIPAIETERIYIAGKTGVGKSTVAASYMKEYQRMFPKNRIILFSRHEDDPAFRGIKHIAVPLDEETMQSPPEMESLRDSLVVFDDCDNLPDKSISGVMDKLNNDIISNGRKFNIHTIYIGHLLFNYKATRSLLNEANKLVFFLNGNHVHSDRWMKEHAGFDRQLIRRINGLKSRWVCVDVGMPSYVVYEHGVFLVPR